MNFLIPNWYSHNLNEIISVLQQKNHIIISYENIPRNFHYDPVFRKHFIQSITEQEIDIVFSLQYFPIISNICENLKIPYICWCYNDQINSLLLTNSIYNSCNYIFHTDSKWIEKLQRIGISQIYYLPWAAKVTNQISKQTPDASFPYTADIGLISTSTETSQHLYQRLVSQLDKNTKGFIDGILHAQEAIYGFNFLENILNDAMLSPLQAAFPLSIPKENLATPDELYAFQVLYPLVTRREFDSILNMLEQEQQLDTNLYAPDTNYNLKHIRQHDLPACINTLSDIYTSSKINLFTAPREIQNGIPVQAIDIMGCGSFLLTNFQNDFLHFFEPGVDYVYYESTTDMLDKVHYYLQHEKERDAIAANAFQKIAREHTFELRIHELMELLNLN